jgi:hypothetical protein
MKGAGAAAVVVVVVLVGLVVPTSEVVVDAPAVSAFLTWPGAAALPWSSALAASAVPEKSPDIGMLRHIAVSETASVRLRCLFVSVVLFVVLTGGLPSEVEGVHPAGVTDRESPCSLGQVGLATHSPRGLGDRVFSVRAPRVRAGVDRADHSFRHTN